MPGKSHRYLAADHERLDALLESAMSDPENIDTAAYAQFHAGLLKRVASITNALSTCGNTFTSG
jgi:hypothetical protein